MKNKKIFYILFLVFFTMILLGVFMISRDYLEKKESQEVYEELSEYIEVEDNVIDNKETLLFPSVDFESLKKINKSILAWIYLENLNISYPVVQGEDNDFYLNHLVDGTYNKFGSIFLDYRNNRDFNDKHSVIYGHHTKVDSMFTNLEKYKNSDFYKENPYYLLVTPDKKYKVEIVSGYVASTDDSSWQLNFINEEEFVIWINSTLEKSIFESLTIPNTQDKFVTLSTCSHEFNNARFVLVGVLKEYIE